MGDLSGKRAVVCGSTQGIGRACAEELAGRGADVVLVARNEASLREVAASLATDPATVARRTTESFCRLFGGPAAQWIAQWYPE